MRRERKRCGDRCREKETRAPERSAIPGPPSAVDEDQADHEPDERTMEEAESIGCALRGRSAEARREKKQTVAEREEAREHAEHERIAEARRPRVRHDRLEADVGLVTGDERAPAHDDVLEADENERE